MHSTGKNVQEIMHSSIANNMLRLLAISALGSTCPDTCMAKLESKSRFLMNNSYRSANMAYVVTTNAQNAKLFSLKIGDRGARWCNLLVSCGHLGHISVFVTNICALCLAAMDVVSIRATVTIPIVKK